MKNTKFDAPTEYSRFLQGVIEEVRTLSVDDFDRKPHDLVVNGVIKIIDFPFFNWSEKLKKDFILIMTRHLKSKNYSIDFLKELKEQFAYELQRNEMKWGTDVFDNSNYSNIFFIIWRSENTNGVRKQMSRKVLIYIDDTIKKLEQIEPAQPQLITKGNPEPIRKQILFDGDETIEKLHDKLKGYFQHKETELLKALKGEQITDFLYFPHNQNKLVEVFRRLKYNGLILNNDTEIMVWICETFVFKKRDLEEPQPFNKNTVWDNLNKGKGEPRKKERICIDENWIPYKNPDKLKREKENEQL